MLTVRRMEEIMVALILGTRLRALGPEEQAFRDRVRRDIQAIEDAGMVADVPRDTPDLGRPSELA